MNGVVEVLNGMPPWLGSVPTWTLLIIVSSYLLLQWLKNQPIISQQKIDERLNIKSGYIGRIAALEAAAETNRLAHETAIKECRDNCDLQEQRLQGEIDLLKTKLNNEAWQRVQSEISLVNTLLDVVDAPQLKAILKALEQRRATIPPLLIEGAEGHDIEGA